MGLGLISSFTGITGIAVHLVYLQLFEDCSSGTVLSPATTTAGCVGTLINHWNWFLIMYQRGMEITELFLLIFLEVWILPLLLIMRFEYFSLLNKSDASKNQQGRKSSFAFRRKMSAIVLEIGELVSIVDSDRSRERILGFFSKNMSLSHFVPSYFA